MMDAFRTLMPTSIALNASRILCSVHSLYEVGRFFAASEFDVLSKHPKADRVTMRSLRGL